MDTVLDSVADFLRVRQLNIAVAALLALIYLIYQYRDILFKGQEDDYELPRKRSTRLSRSRSRSHTPQEKDHKMVEKNDRRGRKPRRCPHCSNF